MGEKYYLPASSRQKSVAEPERIITSVPKPEVWRSILLFAGDLFSWSGKHLGEAVGEMASGGMRLDKEANFWEAIERDMDLATEAEFVKKELVDLIILHLRENSIDVATAKQLASDFLALLPFEDQQDLLGKLKNLGEKYGEAKEIYVEELVKVENESRNITLNNMRDAIKKGNIDAAIIAAKSMQKAVVPAEKRGGG